MAKEGYNPFVSVILPTHNRPNLLPRAISSVFKQTYRNFELIIIDDGSAEETGNVIKGFDDSRIRSIRLEKSVGGAAARNKGIEASTGDLLAFIDDDDEWLPERLQKQIEIFRTGPPDLGFVYSGQTIILESEEVGTIPKCRGKIGRLQLKEDHIFGTSTWLVKRTSIEDERVGPFDGRLPARQDYDLSLRISQFYSVDFCAECLVRTYRDSDFCISSNVEKRVEGHLMVIEKINRMYDMGRLERRMVNSAHYYSIGVYYHTHKRIEEAKRYFKMALRKWPFNMRAFVFLFLLSVGDEDIKTYKWFAGVKNKVARFRR